MQKLPLLLLPLLAACGEEPGDSLPDATTLDTGASDSGSSDAGADAGTCPGDPSCAEVDAGFTCTGGTGTFHDQSITVEGEARYYFLHVPAGYDCDRGAPLWIDFHGTAGDFAEEAYRTDEIVQVADAEGAIVVRPRSRYSETDFGRTYRWDQNPGDIERNVRFTDQLIAELGGLYHLDPVRRYASGFSSGANMAAQFLGRDRTEFRGVAMVGGGYWANPQIPADLSASELRVFAVTGYRDYLINTLLPLLAELEQKGLASDRVFFRQTDSGHELYGWELKEIYAWLDRGERPSDGGLSSRWTVDPTFPTTESLTQLAVTATGELLTTSHEGALHRYANGAWSEVGSTSGPLTGICMLPSGRGMAVGAGSVALTDDGGATWQAAPPAPELEGQWFGTAYLNDVSCFGADSILAAGYWSAVRSDDRAANYRAAHLSLGGFDVPAQVAGLEVSSSSSAVAAGYYYLGRSDDAENFTDVGLPEGIEWLNDVAWAGGTLWFVAGEAGTIARSIDDGLTWRVQETPALEDLYAIDFWDESVGIAVGVHGAAFYTEDGGDTWQDVSLGLDRFLGDVRWIDASTAVAVGERGAVLHFAR